MIRLKKDRDFFSVFDDVSGVYMRTGIFENGKDTGKDPFMASFPELLDVGIMGHCTHGKTGLCLRAGVQCYQRGPYSDKPNMSIHQFREIVEQCRGRTFQIALGGCGDPDQHESFKEILQLCRDYGIVPNFTTSGYGMTEKIAALCARYCGAVAVSWYRSSYTIRAIELLLNAGVKTNIHYVLSSQSLREAIDKLRSNDFPTGINAVVFLLHKPVGLGRKELVIQHDSADFQEFLNTIEDRSSDFKIGFDSCTVPALVRHGKSIDLSSIDTCEGARWSAYITPDMKMLPCSFDNQDLKWTVDLTMHSIEEAWTSNVFDDFRNRLQSACPECLRRDHCMGGCPICPEIVLCKDAQTMNAV